MSTPANRGVAKLRPVEILSVKLEQTYVVRFLGGYSGTVLHWVGKHYFPCLRPEADCPASIHLKPKLWRGWAPVEVFDQVAQVWWPMALEVTAFLEEILRGRALRGEVWSVSRPDEKGKSSPVVGIYVEKQDPEKLRKPFDLKSVLLRAYNLEDIPLGKPNMTPPKLILEPVVGELPKTLEELLPVEPAPISPEERAKLRAQMQSMSKSLGHNASGSTNGKGVAHRG